MKPIDTTNAPMFPITAPTPVTYRPRWEYARIVAFGDSIATSNTLEHLVETPINLDDAMNKAGQEGWEVVGFTRTELGGTIILFKRQIGE